MLKLVAATALQRMQPLFEGVPGLHGCVDAALEGSMGQVYADAEEQPSIAVIHLDFCVMAGDAHAPDAEDAVRRIEPPASIVVGSDAWEPLLQRIWGESLRIRRRVAFSRADWDRHRLRAFGDALPAGMNVCKIGSTDARGFEDLAESLVYNFDSLDDFVDRGVGFGIEHEGRFVSGCSSFAISSNSLEFEIQTHPDYRRRGLALATASAMIEYCLDHGLEPCWDAHNSMSAALATKLGFVSPRPYTAYELPADARPAG